MTRIATLGLVLVCCSSVGLLGCGDGEEGKYHPPHHGTGGRAGTGGSTATGGHAATGGESAGTGGASETGGATGETGGTSGTAGTTGETGGGSGIGGASAGAAGEPVTAGTTGETGGGSGTGGTTSGTGGGATGGQAGAAASAGEAGTAGAAGSAMAGAAGEAGAAGTPSAGSAGEGGVAGAAGAGATGGGATGGSTEVVAGAAGMAGTATGGSETGGSGGSETGGSGGSETGGSGGSETGGSGGSETGGSGGSETGGSGGSETGGSGGSETGGSGGSETGGAAGSGGAELTCLISSPVFTPLHPFLNGVPVESGGDRVSSPGAPYQARVEVRTNSADGQSVELSVGGLEVASSTVLSGVAAFAGITFDPDGSYNVQAACSSGAEEALSDIVVFPVDTAAPVLTITKVTGTGTSPLQDADHFGTADDSDSERYGVQMRLCGTTSSSDAIDLDRDNFTVRMLPGLGLVGAGPVLSTTDNGACVDVDCPGSGSFDLVLALQDAAGNPTEITRNNLTCTSDNVQVSIVDPAWSGVMPRVLAADDTQPTEDGAQYTVVACTNAAVGSAANLYSGLASGDLTYVTTGLVTEDALGGPCDASQLNLIVYPDALLTPSGEDPSSYELTDPTRLVVEVVDAEDPERFGYGETEVWVDVTPPALSLETAGICDVAITSLSAITRTLTFATPLASATRPVTVLVTDQDHNTVPFYGTVLDPGPRTDVDVRFELGANSWTASVTEPSGNASSVGPCAVSVSPGPLPTMAWTAPTEGVDLIATVDAVDGTPPLEDADPDPGAPGWQGTLSVSTSIREAGVTVTFESVSADGLMTTVLGTDEVDSTTGVASLDLGAAHGVPEGMGLRLRARTSGGTAPSATATIVVDVDVTPPGDPNNLSVDAPLDHADDPRRRITTMALSWTSGGGATGYEIYMNGVAITEDDFGEAPQTPIVFGGQPQPEGADESLDVTDLYIENDYFFALRAVDAVGNRSAVAATTVAGRGSLIPTDIASPEGTARVGFGFAIDGSSDLNGDGYSDLLVGEYNGTTAYLYLGGPNGVATSPAVVFHEKPDGQTETAGFGFALAGIGDLNGDGIGDVAIGSYMEAAQDGVTYVFYGNATWETSSPTALYASADADLTIVGDSTGEPRYAVGWLGYSLARLGDFDGDGTDDFAVGVPYFTDADVYYWIGQVAVILGDASRTAHTTLTLPAAFGAGDAIRIDGLEADGSLGTSVAGLGRFYGPDDNPVLIASAPYAADGLIYAVAGASGSPPPLSILLDDAPVLAGSVAGQQLGLAGLYAVGDLGPLGNLALGIPSPGRPAEGRAYVWSGMPAPAEGPFTASITLAPPAGEEDNRFGRSIVGGIVPGTGTPVSFIGNSRSDLIVSSRPTDVVHGGYSPRLYLVDGAKIRLDGVEATVDTVAQAMVLLPTDWIDFAAQVTALRDVDADGHGDFAVGETDWNAGIADLNPGRIRVYR